MVRVITIEREYGSGGVEIAMRLAERLGWELVDHSLVEKVAEVCEVEPSLAEKRDERCDPWFHRFSKAFWRGSPDRSLNTGPIPTFDSDRMAEQMQTLIDQAADRGNCVIVGRGAACILSSRIDAFHVFIYGCRGEKLEYARKYLPDVAPEKLEHKDRERAAYIREYFNLDWDNRKLYDMMVNSAVGQSAVVEAVMCAAGLRQAESRLQSA